jgi:lysophospholipase L1-like esterase
MKQSIFILILLFAWGRSLAQVSNPFYNDIQAFKSLDSAAFPAKGQILFIGSSSFTKWTDVQDNFPGYSILNRAFGGSTLLDQIYYRQDVMFRYSPRQIVIYCGENDFAYSDTVSVATVVNRFKLLFSYIRQRYKKIPVVYVSMKPSPARLKLLYKYTTANKEIMQYLSAQRHADFVNVYNTMLGINGRPEPSIFLPDSLHMNAKGYAIWQKILKPYLVKQ